ncbi:MAG: response regulator transcription factor [Thermomicrobiales bacterium]|nr:response regulator transcription factor [Thermomicrobiales bacterium]
MSERPRILVVDDEENIRFLVVTALELAGMEAATAATGREALDLIASRRPDAVVLDVMLPDLDGFTVLQRMRDQGNDVPVVFLTARNTTADRVRGLSDGGDDYLVKPFEVAELVARVQLRLRRAGEPAASRRLRCADLEMDTERHRVTRGGRAIHLSPTEYKLLHYLIVNVGRVLTRAQILDHVWAYDYDGDPAVVDTYMSYLRRKVDQEGEKLIHTVRGIGFTLRIEP